MSHAWGENRILTHLKEGRQLYQALYKGNQHAGIPAPRFISCWISEVCNLDCTYCFFSNTNHDKSHTYIDTDRFLKWIAQAKEAGAEALEFSGGGEPTLNPRFQEIYERAYGMGYQLGLITHACNPMPLESMVKHFKYIRCGLDAATTETHDLIKRNKRTGYWFQKAIENIKELVRLRDEINPDGFTVGIKVVINSINYKELRDICDLGRFLKVNYVQFKYEHSSDHVLSEETLINLQTQIDDESSQIGLTRVTGTMSHARATTKCFMSAIHTVITATGKVLQCCFFEDRPIGNISQDFHEVWGSEAHRKVVEMTTVQECDKVDCRWNYYNSQMKNVIEDPLAKTSFI